MSNNNNENFTVTIEFIDGGYLITFPDETKAMASSAKLLVEKIGAKSRELNLGKRPVNIKKKKL